MPHCPSVHSKPASRSLPARLRITLGTVLGAGLLLPLIWAAATPESRAFGLPSGNALVTLQQFPAHSGSELLYSSDDAPGITNPPSGRTR